MKFESRAHNRFGGMRDLAIFGGDTRDAGWKQERDAGILITSGSGISYFYGDGIPESWGKNSGIREFSFVLTKNLFELTERKVFFSVYRLCSEATSVKRK